MSFLKRLFSSSNSEKKQGDQQGIYFYVKCNNCGVITRVRADKQHDLNQGDSGDYEWHKTIVDNKCFRRMETVVYLDRGYNVTHTEITGGVYVTEAEYEAWRESVGGNRESVIRNP